MWMPRILIITLLSLLSLPTVGAWAAEVVFAINAAGAAYPASDGQVYEADTKFIGGSIDNSMATPLPIAGTEEDALYQSWRWGNAFRYEIPVANGDYWVTLKFSENVHAAVGRRRFHVRIEDVEVLNNLDVFAEVGARTAHDVLLPATVSDGVLTIAFIRSTGNAMVSAILVETADTTPPPPPPPPPSVNITLRWEAVPGAQGYRVYQSGDLGETWRVVADTAQTTATIAAPGLGLVLYRAGAYDATSETIRMHAGAWLNHAWQPLGQTIMGMP